MTTNIILNYDTIGSNKINNNAFNTIIPMNKSILKPKKVYLRSIELPPITNLRSPYNFFSYTVTNAALVSTKYQFVIPERNYTSISSLLSDINALCVSNIQSKLLLTEVAPIFSLSTTDPNKISITYTYTTSTIVFNDEGILFYYLGRAIFSTPIVIGITLKTQTLSCLNIYNLNFDSYVNLYFSNVSSINKNNNNTPCDFKIIMMSNSLSYSFNNEISCNQFIELTNISSLNSLNVTIFDRYNNVLYSIHDFSFTLEYQF